MSSSSESSNFSTFNSNLSDSLLHSVSSGVYEDKNIDENILDNFNKKDNFKDLNINEMSWKILDNYFSEPNRLTQHHHDSFNHYITTSMPAIIKGYNPIVVKSNYNIKFKKFMTECHITFDNVCIGKPGIKEKDGTTKLMYPIEARWRNLTYSSDVYMDVKIKLIKHSENDENEFSIKEYSPIEKKLFYNCPLLVGFGLNKKIFGECMYDMGGYFILKGAEKVLIPQERKCENKILSFSHNKNTTPYSNTVEISSVPYPNLYSKITQLRLYKKGGNGTIRVFIQKFKNESLLPLFIVFRALGVISDKDIIERILYNTEDPKNKKLLDLLIYSCKESSAVQTQDMALLYLSEHVSRLSENEGDVDDETHRKNNVIKLLRTELFPHIGNDFMKKSFFLGMMAKKLLETTLGIKKHDDRDSFINKRISSTGVLMEELFRNNFNKFIKDIITGVKKDMDNERFNEIPTTISKKIGSNTIGGSMRFSLGTGTWGMQSQANSSKKGIAQPLNRLSYSYTMSHLRRVNAPKADSGGKLTEPRKLHSTQWSRFCPSETPDGAAVGILKNLALMSHITIGSDPEILISYLQKISHVNYILDVSPKKMGEEVRIFINGNPYGCTPNPSYVVSYLRNLRRKGSIDTYISISWIIEQQEIQIHTEGGRISRPLFIVKNNRLVIKPSDFNNKWVDLLNDGCIEYLDVQEEDTTMVATYYEDLIKNNEENETYIRYTHCEINPAMLFGVAACTIPFVEHNQGIRIMYESAQKKQSLSVYASNYRNRMDNPGQILLYAQAPLVTTQPSKYLHERELPSGQNIVVAICCYTGYNQEDSLILNRSSVERGMFSSMYYKTFKDTEKKNQASLEVEKFCKPEKYNPNGTLRTAGTKSSSYDELDENGFVKVGAHVNDDDVIIGKVIPLKNTKEAGPKFKDASTTTGTHGAGIVDWVYVNSDSNGYQFAKVRIRSKRTPNIGDKFASRYGQKGTVGMIYNQEDMPVTAEGITPDIIVNPAAIPSRMTIGQLLESVIGKAASIHGFECDATAFASDNSNKAEKISSILKSAGFQEHGTEEMYNGRNGTKFSAKIFIGINYYQKLKHMVEDKIHARATGPLQLLTRQPPEGRKRDGGFKFGEMERDCMLGHAAVGFLKEKMFDCSDKYAFYVCNKCGQIAVSNPSKNLFKCLSCKDSTDFSQVQVPYATKLFFQELMCMNILPRLITDSEK